jgi:hypothetical protein
MPEIIPLWAKVIFIICLAFLIFLPRVVYRITNPSGDDGPIPVVENLKYWIKRAHRPSRSVFWDHFLIWSFSSGLTFFAIALVGDGSYGLVLVSWLSAPLKWLTTTIGIGPVSTVGSWPLLLSLLVFWSVALAFAALATSSIAKSPDNPT